MRKNIFKIIMLLIPLLMLLLFFRQDHIIPQSQTIIEEFSKLPNISQEIRDDMEYVKTTFEEMTTSFEFQSWMFPDFDASTPVSFFRSIGTFLTSFMINLTNTFATLFSGLTSFFGTIGSIIRLIGRTIVNVIEYLFGIFKILFS